MKKAVFLDRDGVINQTIFRMGKPRAPYELEELDLLPGVPQAIKELKSAGFLTIIVTNQPDVVRGWVSREKVEAMNVKIMELLAVDEIKCCFHVEKDDCLCRKPKPGMLLEASNHWNIDPSLSFMVGDRFSDVKAGKNAGCRSILIGPGDPSEKLVEPDHRSLSLLEAVRWILDMGP